MQLIANGAGPFVSSVKAIVRFTLINYTCRKKITAEQKKQKVERKRSETVQ